MNLLNRISLAALAVIAFVGTAFGQASMNFTTLSANVNATTHSIQLASVSNVNPPGNPISTSAIGTPSGAANFTILEVDNEAMQVLSINGNVVSVNRGWQGTLVGPHNSGARVWVGPPEYFANLDPSGSCTPSALRVLPVVALKTGNVWTCPGPNSVWTLFAPYSDRMTVGPAIASASTIAPAAPITHVTGSAAIATITVPAALPYTGGCITLIPDGAFTTTTGGNIAHASTAVVGVNMQVCYDPAAAKWYPSY